MSLTPQSENRAVVQRTELQPLDPKDSRSRWQRFVDFLRQNIGLKPLYLAERYAEAKVRQEEAKARQEEVDADVRLLQAKVDYERALVEAEKMRRESAGKRAKDVAQAGLTKAVTRLINAGELDCVEAIEELQAIIQRIQSQGGLVEFELPEPEEGEAGDEDPGAPPR